MFTKLIDFSMANRHALLLLFILMGIFAGIKLQSLNLDSFPEVSNIQVSINTESPGLGAEEVEKLITFPIESVMYSLPDVKNVRSISKPGLSIVTVVFKDSVDLYFARQLVFERLQQAQTMIPDGVGIPSMGPNTSGLGQVFQYTLSSNDAQQYDASRLRSLNDWVIKLLLMPVDGVTEVLSFGGHVKQYQVNVEPHGLQNFDVSLTDVQQALQRNNRNAGGWYLERGQEQLLIRGVGWISDQQQAITDIENIAIKTLGSHSVFIKDVAQVKIGGEIRQGAVTLSVRNSDNSITTKGEVVAGIILKRMGADTQATIDGVRDRVKMIQQALPDDVQFDVIYDQGSLINAAVNTVSSALVQAFVFIIVIIGLFLMNLTATLLVLLSIPISIVFALAIMSAYGMSANLMSLGGLAVAIGMLVDGSVVMVESILKKLQAIPHKSLKNIIREGALDVAKPIVFSTMIVLIVFIPLFSFEGVEAKLFTPMAISIMLAVFIAMIIAIVFVPILALYVFKTRKTQRDSPLMRYSLLGYQKTLATALQHPKAIMFAAAILLMGALITLEKLGSEFVPELEEGTMNIRVTLSSSASLTTALSVAPKLEQIILQFPETNYALSRIGRPEIGGDPEPVSNIEIYVGLKPLSQWTSAPNRLALQALIEEKLADFPGLLFTFSQPIATSVDELLSGVKAQLAIKLFGSDLSVLQTHAKNMSEIIESVAGTTAVALESQGNETQLIIRPKRDQLSRYGLSVDDVMNLVEVGMGGTQVGQIIEGNERYDIYLRMARSSRSHINAIKNLPIHVSHITPNGAQLTLADVADVAFESGVAQVRRDNVQRRVVVQANITGRDMGSVVQDIQLALNDKLNLPVGYSYEISGQYENQLRAQNKLTMVIPMSLLMIGVLLFFAFNSLPQTLLILINVPLALVGGIFSLWVSGHYLSVPSAIGFITLFALAVLNGVVMVENINQKIRQGIALNKAVYLGASERLRPVLMTALTTALGLIPMLLSQGIGSEIQKPLATVIVGGLLTSTILTLFVIPVLFQYFKLADHGPRT